jgi:hypothetical protein
VASELTGLPPSMLGAAAWVRPQLVLKISKAAPERQASNAGGSLTGWVKIMGSFRNPRLA